MTEQLNTYELSRNFWNWAFDNPEKIKPNHSAIYFFAIEHCNRLGGKIKFGFPSLMTMEAIGIKKHQTYSRYFNELIEYEFFELIERSKNQYSANIISIIHAKPKKGKALDKAFIKHRAKQTESIGQSKDYIGKQVNKEQETNKQYILNDSIWIENICMKKRLDKDKVELYIGTFLDDLELKDELDKSQKEIKIHFINWLNGELKKESVIKSKTKYVI